MLNWKLVLFVHLTFTLVKIHSIKCTKFERFAYLEKVSTWKNSALVLGLEKIWSKEREKGKFIYA